MVDLVKSAATAKRLIEKHARSVTFFKDNRNAEDPVEPWRGPVIDANPSPAQGGTTLTVLACFVPAGGSGLGFMANDREASEVRDSGQVAIVAAKSMPTGTDLALFDSIRDGASVWKIVKVNLLRPASGPVLWEVTVIR